MGNFNRFYYPNGVLTDELTQNGYMGFSTSMTLEYCIGVCYNKTKFSYAGIHNG